MTNTTINVSMTTATATVTLAGVATATLTIDGAASTSESYVSSMVPPTASTAAAGTNPISLGAPVISYTGLSSLPAEHVAHLDVARVLHTGHAGGRRLRGQRRRDRPRHRLRRHSYRAVSR